MNLRLKRAPGIYLVGFMGCGKSTVGRVLADELGWSFFDLDDEIENGAGTTIGEIFDTQGEEIFRAMEAKALAKRVRAVQPVFTIPFSLARITPNSRRSRITSPIISL